jgi:hypothetical protein
VLHQSYEKGTKITKRSKRTIEQNKEAGKPARISQTRIVERDEKKKE